MSEDIKQAVEAVKDIHKAFDAFKQVDAERDAEIKRLGAALPETEAKMAKIEAALDVAQKNADEAVLAAKRQSRVVTDANGNEIDFEAKAAAWANEASLTTKRSAGEFGAKQMRESTSKLQQQNLNLKLED